MMRLNVNTEALEAAHAALREAERLCTEGFDHVDEVKGRISTAIEQAETFRADVQAALNSHVA